MCGEALNYPELFKTHFKQSLLALSQDPVIGVRMALARVLRHHYVTYLTSSLIRVREVHIAVTRLQQDRNSDIRQLVGFIPLQLFDVDPEVSNTYSENPLLEFTTLPTESVEGSINPDDLCRESEPRSSRMSTYQIDYEFGLEIVITEAMDAASQRYIADQSKLRASIMGDMLYK
jgi:hypothetical protein